MFQTASHRNRNCDISADGTRLLIQVPDRTHASTQQIVVVLHWFEELKRLMPRP